MENPQFIIDYETIKALAVDARLEIIKLLSEKEMTLTEISEHLDLKPSTVKEHLNKLLNSKLIEREETNRKWKYYSLTRKGKRLTNKNETNTLFMLFSSIILSTISGFLLIKNWFFAKSESLLMATRTMGTESVENSVQTMVVEEPIKNASSFVLPNLNNIPYGVLIFFMISFSFLVFSIIYYFKKRK